MAVNKDGNLYVTDHGNHRVQAYDKFGAFITEFGSKGTKDGQFTGPTGIAVDQSGIVFVADWENHRIQVFSADGTFLAKFGTKGKSFEMSSKITVCNTQPRTQGHRVLYISSKTLKALE